MLLNRIIAYPFALLCLMLIEACCTLGLCFQFSQYNLIAWLAQVCCIVLTFGITEKIVQEDEKKTNN